MTPLRAAALLLILLSITTGAAPPATAADAQDPDDVNAALRYWWISGQVWFEDVREITRSDEGVADPEAKIPASLADFFESEYSPRNISPDVPGLIVDATKHERSDFQLRTELGFHLLLPHIREMRLQHTILAWDARRRLDEGERALAIERIAAMVRMAEHVTQDRIVVCSKVAEDLLETSIALIDYAEPDGGFDASESTVLLEALNRFPDGDPLRFKVATVSEGERMISWLRARIDSMQGVNEIMRTLESIAYIGGGGPMEEGPLAFGKDVLMYGGWDAAVDGYERYHEFVAKIWDAENAQERLRTVSAQKYGPLFKAFASRPQIEAARAADDQVDALRARLQPR